MKISIFTKPANKLKHPSSGDFWKNRHGTWNIAVQELGDEKYEILIAIHALIENYLIEQKKINKQKIKYFDESRMVEPDEDPGDDPASPYHREHSFATFVEMQIANELNLSWDMDEK